MKEIRDSKILITGGAGFIGSHLVDALIDNNKVVVVDDLSTGKQKNLPKNDNLEFIEHSIADKDFMSNLLEKHNFDYIYLLAAVASVFDSVDRPIETHLVNQEANINIIDIIRTKKLTIKKLLFTSSSAVYGSNPDLPKNEESSVITPVSPYGIDKYASERFILTYGQLYNIPTVATRFFNVFGPRQNPGSPYSGVLSKVLDSLEHDSEFIIFGDGHQTRDFVYVKDVIKSLLLLMTEDSALHDVYNVATGVEQSLNSVIKISEKISGEKLSITYRDRRAGDIDHTRGDISKLLNLGYRYDYDFESGLSEYYQIINN